MHYDLAVVGGGLVGASLIAALADLPLKIALIEAKTPTLDDARLFGLNYTSCQLLKNIGIWSALSSHATPIHSVHVSYRGHFGAVRLGREELSLPALGYVVPAYLIETALNEKLKTQSNVTLYQPATLQQLSQEKEATLSVLQQGVQKTISTHCVIGADGAASTVRQLLNIHHDTNDCEQVAIVTRITLQENHTNIAYERFTSTGAIAILPLPGRECAVIWTVHRSQFASLQSLTDEMFLKQLQEVFGYKLGRFQAIGKRQHYPLMQMCAQKGYVNRVLLLGNALHALHPIAAQGLNLGLYETAVFVDYVREQIACGKSLAELNIAAISAAFEKQQAISMGVTNRLSRWFSSRSIWMSMALPLGMAAFDQLLPLKQKCLNALLGREGIVPRLLLEP